MAATDGQILVAAARWSDEGSYLREFIPKHRLPAVVKFTKGQYGGLGVPTLPCPGLQSAALLVSAGRRRQIVAQAVKLKEGRRLVCVGPRLAIPESYAGYFELLSEEGRAVRCMESVAELARRRLAGCLVRESMRVLQGRSETDGSTSAGPARNLPAGETLIPEGEIHVNGVKGKFLKCIDSKGDIILLGLEQRGRFSALAKEDNISGVHTAKNLLSKRFPLTVRLVHGTPPRGLKSASHFVPELRLIASFEEEHVFALPLQKDSSALVALPLAAPLKLQKCRNDDQIKNFMEFSRLVEKCNRLLGEVTDKMHVLDGKLGDPKRSTQAPTKTGYFLRRSASSDSANHSHKYGHIVNSHRSHIHSHNHSHKEDIKSSPLPDEYDEIDQIYDYVRGFAPLPKHIKSPYGCDPSQIITRHESAPTSPVTTPIHMPLITDSRPEPPPIETIPGKKPPSAPINMGKAEKRTRKTAVSTLKDIPVILYKEKCSMAPASNNLPKLYIKNNNSSQRNRMVFRQKSNSPIKDLPSSPLPSPGLNPLLKGGSPLFNIRYKSLSNLQQAMELDGTLDSSHSGGRTSGDSGAGAKVPEKRSRRLSRPKSLTNLVWELRGGGPDPGYEKPKEPTVYRKNANKLSLSGQKRVSTLYL